MDAELRASNAHNSDLVSRRGLIDNSFWQGPWVCWLSILTQQQTIRCFTFCFQSSTYVLKYHDSEDAETWTRGSLMMLPNITTTSRRPCASVLLERKLKKKRSHAITLVRLCSYTFDLRDLLKWGFVSSFVARFQVRVLCARLPEFKTNRRPTSNFQGMSKLSKPTNLWLTW